MPGVQYFWHIKHPVPEKTFALLDSHTKSRQCQTTVQRQGRVFRVVGRAAHLVVESQFFVLDDVAAGEKAQIGKLYVDVVDEDVVDLEVGIAAVVDEMRDVAVMRGVDGVAKVAVGVVEVEEVRHADLVVLLASGLGFLVVDKLSQVRGDVLTRFNVLQGSDSPSPAVIRLEDAQFDLAAALDHTIPTVGAAPGGERQETEIDNSGERGISLTTRP